MTEIDAPDGGVTLYRDGRYVRVATDDDFGARRWWSRCGRLA